MWSTIKWRLVLMVAMTTSFANVVTVCAREPDWDAIDKNENALIEPSEIPVQDLTVVAKYASLANLDIQQPMPISGLKRGRDRYIEQLDGGGRELRIARKHEFGRVVGSQVRPFGVTGAYSGNYTRDVRQGTIVTFQKAPAAWD